MRVGMLRDAIAQAQGTDEEGELSSVGADVTAREKKLLIDMQARETRLESRLKVLEQEKRALMAMLKHSLAK